MATNGTGLQVFKFGGTSVGTAEAVRLAAGHVAQAAPNVVVVVSAMAGMTDLLLEGVRAAARGELQPARQATQRFSQQHLHLIDTLLEGAQAQALLRTQVKKDVEEYEAIAQSVSVLREATPRVFDVAVARGERLLARIFAETLRKQGIDSECVDATELIYTERRFGSLWPAFERCEAAVQARLGPLFAAKRVVVVPGFIGTGPSGELVTLGRGGSDFSASLLGRLVSASGVVLFKEVDGLMTADPKLVPDAVLVPELHYREAAELAYYGAKVLHPRAMIPLVDRSIPLWVRNTFRSSSGTRVAGDVHSGGYPVRALSSVLGQALVSVEGKGMLGVPGVAARTFAAVSRGGHSVSMISQGSSEASICFVLSDAEADDAAKALQEEFRDELDSGLLERIRVEKGLALVSVVGLGMRGARGIAGRSLTALSRERINIMAIAQGSSELSITVALEAPNVADALRALHREFQLHKRHSLPDTLGREASIAILGLGQIGRAVVEQLSRQETYFREQLSLDLRCVAAADQSGCLVAKERFEVPELRTLCERKARGERLVKREVSSPDEGVLPDLRQHLWPIPLYRPVLVDLTATDTSPLLMEALRHRFHLVLANKRPLSGKQSDFDALFGLAQEQGRFIRYEATVGAGLPVIDTLRKLVESGDEVVSVQGCFSGTLGYLMTQLEAGVSFSAAVREAKRLGYTEPDPKDDLSGMDVARKVLILARTLGRKVELSDVTVEALFPPEMASLSAAEFLERVSELDGPYAERLRHARAQRRALRYVATFDTRGLRVGLEEVPDESPIGRLKGTDNQIVLHTRRYTLNPLVVTGPGAGAEVTASGVVNDILAVATGEELRPLPSHFR